MLCLTLGPSGADWVTLFLARVTHPFALFIQALYAFGLVWIAATRIVAQRSGIVFASLCRSRLVLWSDIYAWYVRSEDTHYGTIETLEIHTDVGIFRLSYRMLTNIEDLLNELEGNAKHAFREPSLLPS